MKTGLKLLSNNHLTNIINEIIGILLFIKLCKIRKPDTKVSGFSLVAGARLEHATFGL